MKLFFNPAKTSRLLLPALLALGLLTGCKTIPGYGTPGRI
jgi:predicted small secreted protein